MSVDHPQLNGEAKVMNQMILQGLQTRLDEAKDKWAKEMPNMPWAYYTTPWTIINEAPLHPGLQYQGSDTS